MTRRAVPVYRRRVVARETGRAFFRPLRAGWDSAARCHLPFSATARLGIRVHFKLDSKVERGTKQRDFLSSMKWRRGRGEAVLLVRRAAQVEWPGSLA